MKLTAVLEGLLFVVGDDGLTIDQISEILELEEEQTKETISELREKYEKEDSGIRINFLGNSLKLTTKNEHKEYYKKLLETPGTNTLSQSALETLAIIAYKEPITRVEVDEIRGVSSSQMIRKLVAKGFIKEIGRSNLPGRPILYKTTSEFLDYFGLSCKEELPKFEFNVNKEKEDDVDLYHSKYQE
ncbi:MAG: SMC-Scp complex subunit ScpB [Bacilli bacterium]|nr:SMC-Scp complex subunit ScpB [Bacilli bacterium]